MPDSAPASVPVLQVEDLTVRFRRRNTDVAAVNGASFSLRAGETMTILGESGSGKSVSLKALMGLLPGYAQVTGKVWLAIRESEQRTEVLGIKPFRYQLAALTLSSVIATAAGMVYLLLIGTATPDATAATTVTIEILVMVVLGGLGTRWGAVAGAIVYIYVQQELLKFAAEPSFANLPAPLRVPLSQPGFLLGALFIAFILFVPGGIASIRLRGKS